MIEIHGVLFFIRGPIFHTGLDGLGGLWFQEANDAIVWGLRYLYGSIGLESLYEGERIL